jgi:hypothetical protein
MNQRQITVLAGVLGSLLLALGGVRLALSRGSGADALWLGKPADVSKLTIAAPGGQSTFAKKDGKWRMVEPIDYPADAVALEDILGRLPDVKLSPALSSNPAKRGLFEVEGPTGLRLALYTAGDKPSLDAHVGKAGSRFDSFFVRLEGSDDVREAAGLARYALDKRPQDWLDKTVASIPSDSIERIKLTSSSGTLVAENGAGGWKIVQPKISADAETVKAALQPLLVSLIRLEAGQVLLPGQFPPAKKGGFEKPWLKLTVKPKNAPEFSLTAGGLSEPGRRWVRKEGDPRVMYVFDAWRLQPFIKSPADFRRKSS